MRHLKKILTISMIGMTLLLTACGEKQTVRKNVSNTELISDKSSEYTEQVVDYVKNGVYDEKYTKINDTCVLFDEDINNEFEMKQTYWSRGALYIVGESTMYRCQLDLYGQIVSIIKYNLEA